MEAVLYVQGDCYVDYTPVSAIDAGQVIQLPDGRAAVATTDIAAGVLGALQVEGQYEVAKTASIVFLAGGRVFWDHSANKAHFKTVNDRDFYVGTVVSDAASAATTVTVNLNVQQRNTIDALNGPSLSVATGTVAAGGFDLPKLYGGAKGLSLTATSEVQCVDILSVDRVAIASNPILEAQFRLGANGSTSAVDISIGFANGTSASDASAVAERCFVHIDGGALDLFAESDDGTTETALVDTTINVTAGSAVSDRVEVWMDARDPADVQIYVNGSLVLSGSTFTLEAATGPLGLLAHLEKSTGTATAGPVYIDRLVCRTME